ncbi:O-antigen ligase family protein [Prochlorococcus sp. AH-716-A09]|nr:O-antigen ligase family protein [Prochlorococcus sp. AH-716-A09]
MEVFINDPLKLGKILFYIGLFLLPSAFSLGSILLIISLIFSFTSAKKNHYNDKLNLTFLISSILLLISSIINFLDPNAINNIENNSYLTFVGLLNWIPHIFLFVGFQKYLTNSIARRNCVIALISGSIPVIFSCFGQSLLNWHGPMQTLFGSVIWYQRPIEGITGITGLFNNPNYLAAWLNIIWPFCLAIMFFDNKNLYKVIIKIILTISIAALIILTGSRSAWICLLIPIPLIFPQKFRKYFFYSIPFITFSILNLSFPLFGKGFQSFLRTIVPEGLWINFTNKGYETLDISRLDIWKYASNFALKNSVFGHGSRSFTSLLFDETGIWKGHTHNLPLELMVSYGIPTALILLLAISYIVYKSYNKLFFSDIKTNKKTIIDKAWIVSLVVLILIHLVDIQYFDGRISIAGWILLAGAKNIIYDDKIKPT